MVPVRPTSGSNQVQPLIPWWAAYLNPHVRHPAPGLPASEVLADELLHYQFALKVLWSDAAEFVVVSPALLPREHPLHAVEAFLENVVRFGLKVMFLPQPQAVVDRSVGFLVITSQRRDLGLIGHSIN